MTIMPPSTATAVPAQRRRPAGLAGPRPPGRACRSGHGLPRSGLGQRVAPRVDGADAEVGRIAARDLELLIDAAAVSLDEDAAAEVDVAGAGRVGAAAEVHHDAAARVRLVAGGVAAFEGHGQAGDGEVAGARLLDPALVDVVAVVAVLQDELRPHAGQAADAVEGEQAAVVV